MKERVLIGMSGGIDSSVSAYLLKKSGYDVVGVTLKHLGDESENSDSKTCCSLDDIYDAKMACYHIGIPHYVVDVRSEFKEEVIDYFVKEYNRGNTPSPCIVCDEKIKIKKMIELADKMGAEYIATGHYCDVGSCKDFKENLLKNSSDVKKDQTYMLYRISSDVLKRMIFPLKDLKKDQVREIAKDAGIKTHAKKDSQGICFAPEGYEEYLKKVLGEKIKEGNFVDKEGVFIAKHKGYQLYTIGQRRGLGLNLGKPFFILDIVPVKNEIVLGEFAELLRRKVELKEYKFNVPIEKLFSLDLIARPRFSSRGNPGKLYSENEKLYFEYYEENAENARGQHLAVYCGEFLVGGGVIV